jgi:hypothetical protein
MKVEDRKDEAFGSKPVSVKFVSEANDRQSCGLGGQMAVRLWQVEVSKF